MKHPDEKQQQQQGQEPAQASSKAMFSSEGAKIVKTIMDAMAAIKKLQGFIGNNQLSALATGLCGEEKQFFIDKIVEISDRIAAMPETYEQDGLGMQAVAYLHYFRGGMDWWITEKDKEREQLQAFGQADFGDGPELGYVSLVELAAMNIELDLFFEPTPLTLIRSRRP